MKQMRWKFITVYNSVNPSIPESDSAASFITIL